MVSKYNRYNYRYANLHFRLTQAHLYRQYEAEPFTSFHHL
jgi:hypothetical protein